MARMKLEFDFIYDDKKEVKQREVEKISRGGSRTHAEHDSKDGIYEELIFMMTELLSTVRKMKARKYFSKLKM